MGCQMRALHTISLRGLPSSLSKISSPSHITTRYASIVAGASASQEPIHHKEWPQHHNPSPYEVLNMKPHEFDAKTLKKKYYQIAKLYHPDISTNNQLLNHKGDLLTAEHKSERFKLLTEAYTLLKDKRKKAMYDQHKVGWGNGGRDSLFNGGATYGFNGTAASARAYDFNDHRYWSASNWEDYQNLRDMNDPALREDKLKALGLIVLFMISGAAIQGWMFLNNMEDVLMERQKLHDSCEADLTTAYLNYGLDTSRLSRIKRFLWFRTFGLYKEREMLDRSARENEVLIKEVMGADA